MPTRNSNRGEVTHVFISGHTFLQVAYARRSVDGLVTTMTDPAWMPAVRRSSLVNRIAPRAAPNPGG
ncbi:MAG: hypothetical protein ABSH33_09140 [Steroidobacteraceae bacterium]